MARTVKPCAVPECDRLTNVPGSARGWCVMHYQRWQRTGDPLTILRRRNGCSVDGCETFVEANGLCSKHYTRMKRYGTTDAPKPWLDLPEGIIWCVGCQGGLPRENFGPLRPSGQSCKACDRKKAAAWRAAHPEYVTPPRDPEKSREWSRRWRANNPDQVRASTQRRRARRMGASVGEQFTTAQICERDDWTCGLCRQPIDAGSTYPDPMSASLDHIVPLARGGEHSRANVQASHLRCNLRKHLAGPSQQLRLVG